MMRVYRGLRPRNSMGKTAVVVAILLTTLSATLEAQSPEQRIETARARASSVGIPVELLDGKVAEGRAKGIPLERIAAAIEGRTAALERAISAMSIDPPDLSNADLVAGADAVAAGVSDAILRTIAERAPRERRAVAITALTALVSRQVTPNEALARVTEALSRGPEFLASLPGQPAVRANVPGAAFDPGARGTGRGPGRDPSSASPAGRPPAVDPTRRAGPEAPRTPGQSGRN